jgi:hypothetical protein
LPSTLKWQRQSDSLQSKTAFRRRHYIVEYINMQARPFDGGVIFDAQNRRTPMPAI